MKTKVKFITPIPYAYLPTKKGVDSKDLVIVSLEQLIKLQEKIEKLEEKEKNEATETMV
jgi:uncharacterized ferredoxin-like protein